MRQQEWAAALRVLADFLDNTPMPGISSPDEPLVLSIQVQSALDVQAIAGQFGAGVKQSINVGEDAVTTFGFGDNGAVLRIFSRREVDQ